MPSGPRVSPSQDVRALRAFPYMPCLRTRVSENRVIPSPNEAVEKVQKQAILTGAVTPAISLGAISMVPIVRENAIHEEIMLRLTIDV